MSAPVLFLDFDGVLNHSGTTQRYRGFTGLDPENVERLNAIMRSVPEARIIVSSSWRVMHPLTELRAALRASGFAFSERVVGRTPLWKTETDAIVGAHPCRGDEIQEWLDGEGDAPSSIAILDDDSDMAHLAPNLIRTDPYAGGLRDDHVVAVVAKLTRVA